MLQLVGKLDSPYVRRVAVSMHLLGLPFEHRPVSVFAGFDEFRKINPVVKAPSLVCGDGLVLMDSTLILDYVESLAGPGRSLMPVQTEPRKLALRLLGLALAAAEKTAQIVYERNLRPAEKQHEPWLDRIRGQLAAAYAEIETELKRQALAAEETSIDQAGITTAIVWRFTQAVLPGHIAATDHPSISSFAAQAETLPAFVAMAPM